MGSAVVANAARCGGMWAARQTTARSAGGYDFKRDACS
jgi:hypothetical protein